MEEKQAIALLKCGDPAGLETLVKCYQLRAMRTAALITGDPASAEDIVQNAFIRAAERIDQFDSQRSFGPWFLRSVVNDAIKAANRQKKQISMDDENQEALAQWVDPVPLPEERVECLEFRQAVWHALKALPPNQRAVVVLRYYLGMNEAEMVVELNKPVGTIKWWLHAARKKLEQLLQPLQTFTAASDEADPIRCESEQEVGDRL